ncbi:Acetyl-coenzyme A synthetase [Minicystis rosea]|nr:Acetyl-coenzyme A synthetase [Minicystis rosea]
MNATATFLRARDFLLAHREDYDAAHAGFAWPDLPEFNWALDWFDVFAANNHRPALTIVNEDLHAEHTSFAELSERSSQLAGYLRAQGVARGDRILLMLPNVLALWRVMLAAIKLGAVVIPSTTQLTVDDLRDRLARGRVRHVITDAAGAEKLAAVDEPFTRLCAGDAPAGWTSLTEADRAPLGFTPDGPTRRDDPLLLYFTSGTTAKPKLVLHTHQSYPVGHLSTMYWIGVKEGDTHQNISSPGWAKHAWSSFFAPWNAGATVLVHNYARFDARRSLDVLHRAAVSTLCAPPTVWRMLIQADLGTKPAALHDLTSAGEPLNPEVIERVRAAWGITIRDGYGQTETTAQVGNTPGQEVRLGSMGRPLPGYEVTLIDAEGREANEGEIALRLARRPIGLMVGYLDDDERTAAVTAGGYYRTGDEAARDADGYFHYVGRGDDVFKSSDYRISPFELESVLLEHPAVAEVAVVPSPDPVRLSVPKAFVVLAPGIAKSAAIAREILAFAKEKLAPYKRVRRVELTDLPKTISGKIRRVELRARERDRAARGERGEHDYGAED